MTPFEKLDDLARNLRWDWHPETRELFRELDPVLWEQVQHNPVALLRRLDPTALGSLDERAGRIDALWSDLRAHVAAEDTWYDRSGSEADRPLTAYFCAEFGLTECLHIYSGGLGVLAGDHLKSASDLGVPMVAVGLLYREGYFNQTLDGAGRQQEEYPLAEFEDLPMRPVLNPDGSAVRVSIPFPGRQVAVGVWRVDVGRVPLFLLDADLAENQPDDRALTSRLYGGAEEMRISQEILLGVGGYRVLNAMGVHPRSFHMNEGHSAFLGIELVRDVMETDGVPFEAAVQAVRQRMVFTTHTPVPAGHDRFPERLVEKYLTEAARAIGLEMPQFMALGRADGDGVDEPFTMTILALRLATQANGVSRLHGAVTRSMWHHLWPDRAAEQVPIEHVTNGVHMPSWMDPAVAAASGVEMAGLGVTDQTPATDPAELWRIRGQLRRRLVDYVGARTDARLDPDALTIAFARRFATYKRATLLLGDLDRLEALLHEADRPVQVVFAGKAHPKDEGGKALIQRIWEVSRDERFHDRLVFVPGYGIDVARELVRGADVWLNNPRRPMEASGTSGMKAAANGVLNVSILDGWWDEAYRDATAANVEIGWAIGSEATAGTAAQADAADEASLFELLEQEVVPRFYDRDGSGVPGAWLERAAASIRVVAPAFSSARMVRDYVERYARAAAQAAAGSQR